MCLVRVAITHHSRRLKRERLLVIRTGQSTQGVQIIAKLFLFEHDKTECVQIVGIIAGFDKATNGPIIIIIINDKKKGGNL